MAESESGSSGQEIQINIKGVQSHTVFGTLIDGRHNTLPLRLIDLGVSTNLHIDLLLIVILLVPARTRKLDRQGPNELKIQVDIALDKTVYELKQAIAAKSDVEADRQRLIYSGLSCHLMKNFCKFLM